MFTTAPDQAPTKGGPGAFVVLEVHLLMLEQLLRYHDPALAAHLEECSINADAYATSWSVSAVQIFVRDGGLGFLNSRCNGQGLALTL